MFQSKLSVLSSQRTTGVQAIPQGSFLIGTGWTEGWGQPFIVSPAELRDEMGVAVRDSSIVDGELGLFATRDFDVEDFIVPYCGVPRSAGELLKKYGVASAQYGAELKAGYTVDASDPQRHGVGRMANDVRPFSKPDEVNAYIRNFEVGPPENPSLVAWPGLYAKKPISAEAEITVQYGDLYWEVWFWRLEWPLWKKLWHRLGTKTWL